MELHYPNGITIHPTTGGQIFVADSDNNHIQVFSDDLKSPSRTLSLFMVIIHLIIAMM